MTSLSFKLNTRQSKNLFFTLLLSTGYSVSFLLIPMDGINDRENYLNYIINSELIIERYLNSGLLTLLSNEPLWLIINNILNSTQLTPQNSVKFIIFTSAFITSFFLIHKRNQINIIIVFVIILLAPQIVKNNIVHLRQGLGIAIFILIYFTTEKTDNRIRALLFFIPGLIHTSFFIIATLLLINNIIDKQRLSKSLKIIFITALMTAVIASLEVIAEVANARQFTQHEWMASNTSGLAFLFWLYILTLIFLKGKYKDLKIPITIIISYLVLYFQSPFSGRILESMLPLILLISMQNLQKKFIPVMAISLFFYNTYLYFINMDKPLFGFGI